jgi:hypothetical protein
VAEGPAASPGAWTALSASRAAAAARTAALHGWPSGRQLFDWPWAMADCEPVAATATIDFRLPQAATPRLRLLFLDCNMFSGLNMLFGLFYFRVTQIEPGMFR